MLQSYLKILVVLLCNEHLAASAGYYLVLCVCISAQAKILVYQGSSTLCEFNSYEGLCT